LSSGFALTDGALACERVPIERIVEDTGTPVYIYSSAAMTAQYGRLERALSSIPHRIHYSVKANSNLAVLAHLRRLGAGLDIVSGGELSRGLQAGFRGEDIVFSGVGKTEAELAQALEAGVLLINVESAGELELLDRVARAVGVRAPVALRINPEVTVDTPHPYTRTGERGTKFGIPYDEAERTAVGALDRAGIELAGLDMHVGSQIGRFDPYEAGLDRLLSLWETLRQRSTSIRYLDVGGGLAVSYDAESPMTVDEFGDRLAARLGSTGATVIVEPGRFIVGNAGILVTRVLYRKRSGGKEVVITDAGMTDLLRPSHYQAFHGIERVRPGAPRVLANVVGPVCESGDFFALDREIEEVSPGDLIAIRSAGAYGFVMASNYNTRPRPSEVMVDGARFGVVTERERYEDIVRNERVEPAWRDV
jgi:diaminopimelate decarboxylase